MLDPLKSGVLSSLPDIQHGFCTRNGCISEGVFSYLSGSPSRDRREAVLQNRRLVGMHLRSKHSALFLPSLCHSAIAAFVNEESSQAPTPAADGVVKKTRKLAVGVLDADCAPVLLADADAVVVGAAHAGWREALEGVLESTMGLMIKHGAKLASIKGAAGPCIQQLAYEVGPEFLEFCGE